MRNINSTVIINVRVEIIYGHVKIFVGITDPQKNRYE